MLNAIAANAILNKRMTDNRCVHLIYIGENPPYKLGTMCVYAQVQMDACLQACLTGKQTNKHTDTGGIDVIGVKVLEFGTIFGNRGRRFTR